VEWLYRDIGSFQASFQERPEVFNVISVDVAVNVLFGVVDYAVNVFIFKASIRPESI